MPTYLFMGDIRHAGRVLVVANSLAEAKRKLIDDDEFEVYDEQHKNLAFDWNGEEPEIVG